MICPVKVCNIENQNFISYTSLVEIGFSMCTHPDEIKWREVLVKQITIDGYCMENSISKVDLIKIDVEGFEKSVLIGTSETVKRNNPVIFCGIFLI